MSQSLASAKKRRAMNETTIPPQQLQQQQSTSNKIQNGGLTLPQVIEIVDRRLTKLEKSIIENKKSEDKEVGNISTEESNKLQNAIEEFDKRYEMLAEEIVNIKNIIISLQSFTMEVNKSLYEEKNQLLSQFSNEVIQPDETNDMTHNSNTVFTFDSNSSESSIHN